MNFALGGGMVGLWDCETSSNWVFGLRWII